MDRLRLSIIFEIPIVKEGIGAETQGQEVFSMNQSSRVERRFLKNISSPLKGGDILKRGYALGLFLLGSSLAPNLFSLPER